MSLALLSAALTAALFLVVLLLINGWRHSPLAAAAVVTVMPLAAFAAYRLVPANAPSARIRAICGAILIAGGLAALALLPAAAWGWLVAPQVAIGVGFALSLGALTQDALAGRSPLAIHGGWTLAARHAGVCLGLLILTPIFTGDLVDQQNAAELAGTRLILDSSLSLTQKVSLGSAIVAQVSSASVTRPPNLHPAFQQAGDSPEVQSAGGCDPGSDRARGHARVQQQLPGGRAAGAAGDAAADPGEGRAVTRQTAWLLAAAAIARRAGGRLRAGRRHRLQAGRRRPTRAPRTSGRMASAAPRRSPSRWGCRRWAVPPATSASPARS